MYSQFSRLHVVSNFKPTIKVVLTEIYILFIIDFMITKMYKST